MDRIKDIFMYLLALVVLLAPAILLGWIGWSLLDWWGGVLGIIAGLALFVYSLKKISAQEQGEEEVLSGDFPASQEAEREATH